MQKWEYAEIEVVIGGPLSGTKADVIFYKASGKHETQGGKLGNILAEMGTDGWESVASSARTDTGLGGKHKINYILKRTLEAM